jgi:plasmid stabilization system protein ParE
MVDIRWTNEAQIWLKDIYDYIALDNPKIAKKVIDEIY